MLIKIDIQRVKIMKWLEYINDYYNNIKNEVRADKNDIYVILSSMYGVSINKFRLDYIYKDINEDDKLKAKKILDRYYIQNIPLQYITGYQNFYNEKYIVNENVLIPRSDTEILVSTAIEYINKENISNVLDMCCGSGAVRCIYC